MEILFVISLALVVYPYLGYPLVLFVLSWFSRREDSAHDNDFRPSISLLMAAYNEEEWTFAAPMSNSTAKLKTTLQNTVAEIGINSTLERKSTENFG